MKAALISVHNGLLAFWVGGCMNTPHIQMVNGVLLLCECVMYGLPNSSLPYAAEAGIEYTYKGPGGCPKALDWPYACSVKAAKRNVHHKRCSYLGLAFTHG